MRLSGHPTELAGFFLALAFLIWLALRRRS